MFKITQPALDLINLGQQWCIVTGEADDKTVHSVHPTRKAARDLVNGNPDLKVTQLNSSMDFEVIEAKLTVLDPHGILASDIADDKSDSDKAFDQPHHGHMDDDSIGGVVQTLQAVGLNPIVIDENTDFKTVFPQGTVGEGEVPQDAVVGEGNSDAAEFNADKIAGAVVAPLSVQPIDPAKEVQPAKPKKDILRSSEPEKPTKLVWAIADALIAANPQITRKEIIKACDNRGIAYSTVRTQFYHWNKHHGHFASAA